MLTSGSGANACVVAIAALAGVERNIAFAVAELAAVLADELLAARDVTGLTLA